MKRARVQVSGQESKYSVASYTQTALASVSNMARDATAYTDVILELLKYQEMYSFRSISP